MDFMDSLDLRAEEGKEQWQGKKWEFGDKDVMAQEGRRRQQQHNLLKRRQSTDLMWPPE